ncbi:uncharacterized protein LOC107495479 [Arachis duranensis]|uniref:Uncharacterized protein LOC107495479 n=1 Tax=Arachis duranensis TaxID=130453 RepID=A0A6P4DQA1_ARADU|nr:uncharacterized protein LOC107495479 [Arachis duranensis]
MPVVVPSCLLAAPSLVLALAARSPGLITGLVVGGELDHVEDAMREDDSDNEPDHISGDKTPVAPPAPQGPSSSGSHQQLPHFSMLNVETTKEKAVISVKDYSIRRGVQYRVMESDHLKYIGRCNEFKSGYTWMIRVALRQRKGNWEVRRADAAITIKVLQEAIKSTYGSGLVIGRCERQSRRQSHRFTGIGKSRDKVDESTEYFYRLFWTFPPCIEAFKHCKPLISIDSMHLYGKYGGTLLLAIAQDENSNILPEGILVISDRHNGIKAALEVPYSGWKLPHAYRAYCIRHVAANFALSFKGQDARQMLGNAVYAKIEAEFDYWFDIMRTENPAMCDWANRLEYDKWTQY